MKNIPFEVIWKFHKLYKNQPTNLYVNTEQNPSSTAAITLAEKNLGDSYNSTVYMATCAIE